MCLSVEDREGAVYRLPFRDSEFGFREQRRQSVREHFVMDITIHFDLV